MRFIIVFLSLFFTILLGDSSLTCKSCHPTIYKEFQNSMHKKSSIYDDKVHKAIWDLHPLKKKQKYKCAKCHTPSDANKDNKQKAKEGISCITCHRIEDIKEHSKANENIFTDKEKTFFSAKKGSEDKKIIFETKSSFFGLFKKVTGSPYHNIDYTNKNYYTAKVCMGCHSHKQNSHGFEVCKTDNKGAENKNKNCITCHMPQIKGSFNTIETTKTHAFHGFSGAVNSPEMLEKYIKLLFKNSSNGFEITIQNNSPHALFIHPLRVAQLRVKITDKNKIRELKPVEFVRMLGNKNKPAMPWDANEIFKDNMIKANEKRVVKFPFKLTNGSMVEAVLGYYIVNPKVIEKLQLQNNKEITKFNILKRDEFIVK